MFQRRNLLLFAAGCFGLVALLASTSNLSIAQGGGKRPTDVLVVNTAGQPVPVSVAYSAPVEPLHTSLSVLVPADALNALSDVRTVPAGKMLVIESASVSVIGYQSGTGIQFTLVIDGYPCALPCGPTGVDLVPNLASIVPLRAHLAPGSQYYIDAKRWPPGVPLSVTVVLFGYYETAP